MRVSSERSPDRFRPFFGRQERRMSIGYACLALAVPGTSIKKCLIRNADGTRLRDLISRNLRALETMVDYNRESGIRLYRISSDIIPFASSPVNDVPWETEYREQLRTIGDKIRAAGMRVSMHPGQYTVLNSPNPETFDNAVRELLYHARFLDALHVGLTHKIILHVGGVYGDKKQAAQRFAYRYAVLDERIRGRLVIENDDKCYHVEDVLSLGKSLMIPVVFDNLHHAANPPGVDSTDADWVAACRETWKAGDGPQKIHYSQEDPLKRRGAHSATIAADEFLLYVNGLPPEKPDIMLEVKDKNISALKCILCTEDRGIGALEKEWGCYKYLVLEHSQKAYQSIRQLLKDKAQYPALAFYSLVEEALAREPDVGSAVNAANHVWGYFKDIATATQKERFAGLMRDYAVGSVSLARVKRSLYALAEAYPREYLLKSYYFV